MTLTVLKPSGLSGDPFITLKAKLSKDVSTFKASLVTTINMLPSVGDIDAVDIEGYTVSQISSIDCFEDQRGSSKRTDPSPAHNGISGNVHLQVASLDDRLLEDYLGIA